jgi:hypothetical protein
MQTGKNIRTGIKLERTLSLVTVYTSENSWWPYMRWPPH